jgi:hypothetical protein
LVIYANPHAHDPLHLEKAYFVQTFVDLNVFFALDALSQALKNIVEVQR